MRQGILGRHLLYLSCRCSVRRVITVGQLKRFQRCLSATWWFYSSLVKQCAQSWAGVSFKQRNIRDFWNCFSFWLTPGHICSSSIFKQLSFIFHQQFSFVRTKILLVIPSPSVLSGDKTNPDKPAITLVKPYKQNITWLVVMNCKLLKSLS